jgi:transposase
MFMDIMYERCCGLDVHKQTVVACVLLPGSGRQPAKEIRTFGTMTAELLELGDWLSEKGVTHVALESTGVYWHPVWNLLEGQVELLLVNAQHIKQVPGRKTDVRDCEWIANLLRHGLLRASFVPERPQRELRELTRYRTSLIRERAAEINRIQKTLEGANIKLGDVASDILGVSARRILEALIGGTTDPAELADLAKDKLRKKIPQLERALKGQFGSHHRFLLAQQFAHLDGVDELIEGLGVEIAERVRPVEHVVERIDAIPGFGRRTAEIVVAEIGTDLSRFPSFKQAADNHTRPSQATDVTPASRLVEELAKGYPLPKTAADYGFAEPGRVSSGALVAMLGNTYSVPIEHVGAQVTVRIHATRIVIWHDAERLAEHARAQTEPTAALSARPTLHPCSGGSRAARSCCIARRCSVWVTSLSST